MKRTVLLLFVVLFAIGLHAQMISNVTATQQGKTIVVNYDLPGTTGEFDVVVYCSTDGGSTFGNPLSAVTGDVGKSIKPGYSKKISWNVLSDRDKLTGSRILFEVRATPVNKLLNDLGIEMVFVKGGTFTMGCTDEQGRDCESDEKPAHQVTLSDFYIGKFEVTQKQWRQVMGASTSLSNPSFFKDCDNCPVEQVSRNHVQEFIIKLNQKTGKTYRLPTEAEWEYAARGGAETHGSASLQQYKYSGSNNIDTVAWYTSNNGSETHPVGQKMPNELGIFDMTGNVWEYCSDWYEGYSSGSQTNPKGGVSGSERVMRGGGWSDFAQRCRVSCRNNRSGDGDCGFRLACSP